MRTYLLLGAASMTLAACGGAGPESVGSVAGPTSSPTTGGTPTPTDIYSQFTNPVDAKTYTGIGGTQSYHYTTLQGGSGQGDQLYQGNASTIRDSAVTIAYDPRDAIFTLTIADNKAGVTNSTRFQDPAHRTNFGGARSPQAGVPDLASVGGGYANANIQYLQVGSAVGSPPDDGSSTTATTFFYEKPGSTNKYVTLAGYVRNTVGYSKATVGGVDIPQDTWTLERGAFAYGALTANNAVPTSGTGTYSGSVLATMVYNPTLDAISGRLPTYFQWLSGTSALTIDFGKQTVALDLAGIVLAPQLDIYTSPQTATIVANSTFKASGTAIIDLVGKGGFAGSFQGGNFTFTAPTGQTFAGGSATATVNVIGSSIDGAFYGPAAEEVGGGFRVVGGVPDQRVDILGAFTAKK